MIYYEDLSCISLWFLGGDGVIRAFPFSPHSSFFPSISDFSLADGKVSVSYASSLSAADRKVTTTKYKFDEGPWVEAIGTLISDLVIPLGAKKIYLTAKDTSDFYYYPPDERSLE
jgi:hypothetical protein